jgi:hypothetical protein
MNKIFTLFSLAVLMLGCTGVSQAKGCPDGSDPVKSISADGTYFVYNCGGSATIDNSNVGKVEVAMKPFSGDWMNHSIYPATMKERLLQKYRWLAGTVYGDMDNDGIDDLVVLATPENNGNKIAGGERPDITGHEVCDITVEEFDCYDKRNNIEIYSKMRYRISIGMEISKNLLKQSVSERQTYLNE